MWSVQPGTSPFYGESAGRQPHHDACAVSGGDCVFWSGVRPHTQATAACTVCMTLQGAGASCFSPTRHECSDADWPTLVNIMGRQSNTTNGATPRLSEQRDSRVPYNATDVCAGCLHLQAKRLTRSGEMNAFAACFPEDTLSSGKCERAELLNMSLAANATTGIVSPACGRCAFLAMSAVPHNDQLSDVHWALRCFASTTGGPVAVNAIAEPSLATLLESSKFNFSAPMVLVVALAVCAVLCAACRRMRRKVAISAPFPAFSSLEDVPVVQSTSNNPILPGLDGLRID
eukprot:SAG22_NODE_98_length_20720_cov_17.226662_21_plen_288_part_00